MDKVWTLDLLVEGNKIGIPKIDKIDKTIQEGDRVSNYLPIAIYLKLW